MLIPTPIAPATSPLVVRMARPEDEAGRLALLAGVAMDAELALSIRRRPTVDAMYALRPLLRFPPALVPIAPPAYGVPPVAVSSGADGEPPVAPSTNLG